jgi:DNA polymerase III epsilon subunit-like protein
MTMIYLDTETTGLDPLQGHEIIEIAIVTDYDDGTTEYWECKIKPKRLDLADPKSLGSEWILRGAVERCQGYERCHH